MATFRSIKEYQEVMRARAARLRKEAIKTSSKAASFMQATAVSLAPRQTGTLIAGIKKKKLSGTAHYAVESTVPGRFKYNLFVNQTAPLRTLRYKIANRRLGIKAGDTLVYGQSYPSHWNITGTPRFFHIATLRTQVKFRIMARQMVRSVLRTTV